MDNDVVHIYNGILATRESEIICRNMNRPRRDCHLPSEVSQAEK